MKILRNNLVAVFGLCDEGTFGASALESITGSIVVDIQEELISDRNEKAEDDEKHVYDPPFQIRTHEQMVIDALDYSWDGRFVKEVSKGGARIADSSSYGVKITGVKLISVKTTTTSVTCVALVEDFDIL